MPGNRDILDGEADVPSIEFPLDGTGLNGFLNSTMKLESDSSYLGKFEALRSYLKAWRLRIGDGVISAFTPESWIASLTRLSFNSTEKILKCFIDSFKDVLKHLRVNLIKSLDFILVGLMYRGLFAICKSFADLFVTVLSVKKAGVVENMADFKRLHKFLSLLFGWKKPVFVGLTHWQEQL